MRDHLAQDLFPVISDADFYPELGKKIRSLREGRGMSQEQLGARLKPELKRGTISAIETAKQRVMAHLIAQLSEALDVDPGVFFPNRNEGAQLDLELQRQLPPDVAREVAAVLEATLGPAQVKR